MARAGAISWARSARRSTARATRFRSCSTRTGVPLKRNFVHVEDLVSAILCALDHAGTRGQTFNVCMDEPVDYGALAGYLAETRGTVGVPVNTPYFSTWLDNSKAKLVLNWRPAFDLKKMTDSAWEYRRAADDPRVVWYPG